jgi:hypothetical protein
MFAFFGFSVAAFPPLGSLVSFGRRLDFLHLCRLPSGLRLNCRHRCGS